MHTEHPAVASVHGVPDWTVAALTEAGVPTVETLHGMHLLFERPRARCQIVGGGGGYGSLVGKPALAVALGAEKLLVLTDVEGLYLDWGRSDDVIGEISPEALEEILPTLASGMIPKMGACLQAVQGGVPRATVVDGREPHAVILELFTNEGVGTQVLPGVETKTRKARETLS